MQIGEFEVLDELGRGGKGIVHKVRHSSGNIFALKEALPGNEERLRKDGYMQANLLHPNIVKTFSVEEINENPYVLMEFIDGPTAEDYISAKGVPDTEAALEQMLMAAEAVKYLHKNNLVHGDIKPRNILLPKGGLKLIDIGYTKTLEESIRNSLSTKSTAVVSQFYAAPELIEQCASENRIVPTKASDIYSLGLVFYRMLTARVPSQHMPPLRKINPALPEKIDEIWSRTAAYDPAERLSADELVELIKEIKHSAAPKPEIVQVSKKCLAASINEHEKMFIEKPGSDYAAPELVKLYSQNGETEKALKVLEKTISTSFPFVEQGVIFSAILNLFETDRLSLSNRKQEIYSAALERIKDLVTNSFMERGEEVQTRSRYETARIALANACCKAAYNGWYRNKEDVYNLVEELCSNINKGIGYNLVICGYNNLGIIRIERKEYRKAKECFDRGCDSAKMFKENYIHNNAGVAEALLQKYAEAEMRLKEAIEIQNNDDDVNAMPSRRYNLALIYNLMGSSDSAKRLLSELTPELAERFERNKGRPDFRLEFPRVNIF